ncbi:MAG: hypothetical protein ACN4E2_02865, partial [Nitrospinota bacterium]
QVQLANSEISTLSKATFLDDIAFALDSSYDIEGDFIDITDDIADTPFNDESSFIKSIEITCSDPLTPVVPSSFITANPTAVNASDITHLETKNVGLVFCYFYIDASYALDDPTTEPLIINDTYEYENSADRVIFNLANIDNVRDFYPTLQDLNVALYVRVAHTYYYGSAIDKIDPNPNSSGSNPNPGRIKSKLYHIKPNSEPYTIGLTLRRPGGGGGDIENGIGDIEQVKIVMDIPNDQISDSSVWIESHTRVESFE